MPERLLLRFAPDGSTTWLGQSADGRALSGSVAGWPPAEVRKSASAIVVLVPAEDVVLTEARVAARNRAQRLQAVPFAIEDRLLDPVEDLHVAIAETGEDTVGVAVVAKTTLDAWLARLADAGIAPDAICAESLALPCVDGRAAALIEGERAIVRLAPWSAFACAPERIGEWIAGAGEATPPLDAVAIGDAPAPAWPAPVESRRERDALAVLARGLGRDAPNFLHGAYAPRHRAARGALWWRRVAALAAAVVVLALANLVFEVVSLSRTSARLVAETEQAARSAFPDIDAEALARSSPVDLVRARVDALRGGAGADGLLSVLSAIAPVIGSTTRVQTRGIEYRNGALELGLRVPDVATLDAVRERLAAAPGLKVAVTAANPGEDGIDGRIRVERARAPGRAP